MIKKIALLSAMLATLSPFWGEVCASEEFLTENKEPSTCRVRETREIPGGSHLEVFLKNPDPLIHILLFLSMTDAISFMRASSTTKNAIKEMEKKGIFINIHDPNYLENFKTMINKSFPDSYPYPYLDKDFMLKLSVKYGLENVVYMFDEAENPSIDNIPLIDDLIKAIDPKYSPAFGVYVVDEFVQLDQKHKPLAEQMLLKIAENHNKSALTAMYIAKALVGFGKKYKRSIVFEKLGYTPEEIEVCINREKQKR